MNKKSYVSGVYFHNKFLFLFIKYRIFSGLSFIVISFFSGVYYFRKTSNIVKSYSAYMPEINLTFDSISYKFRIQLSPDQNGRATGGTFMAIFRFFPPYLLAFFFTVTCLWYCGCISLLVGNFRSVLGNKTPPSEVRLLTYVWVVDKDNVIGNKREMAEWISELFREIRMMEKGRVSPRQDNADPYLKSNIFNIFSCLLCILPDVDFWIFDVTGEPCIHLNVLLYMYWKYFR